jgi:N-acetylglucosamine kinase-like BadF-type ATPase
MTRILIGADVGGTKTAVAVSDGTAILALAEGPGAAVKPGRSLVSAGIIADVCRRALAAAGKLKAEIMVVGAAGAGRQPEQGELQQALRGEGIADRVIVTTDIEVALAGAFGTGPGIVISAGTGSVAVGRDAEGRLHRAGGYGWQMGDEGSGYAIGRAALGAVSRATDGRSPETKLRARLLDLTRSPDFDALVRWAATAGPAEVASLAPATLEVAAAGDVVAQGIADYAARELTQLALHILPRIGGDAPVPVALSGGLLSSESLRRTVLTRLGDEPRLAVLDAPVDAVAGALRIAAAAGAGGPG